MERISKHISYNEGVFSNTAIRKGINNEPTGDQIESMKLLAERIFEPLRAAFGGKPIRISSFFRCTALNVAVGGSKSSQHCKGEGIDIKSTTATTNKELFDYIKDNLEFDQLIWEYGDENNPDWIHVSFTDRYPNRGVVLKAVKGEGYINY